MLVKTSIGTRHLPDKTYLIKNKCIRHIKLTSWIPRKMLNINYSNLQTKHVKVSKIKMFISYLQNIDNLCINLLKGTTLDIQLQYFEHTNKIKHT